jgi:hypothetical protein
MVVMVPAGLVSLSIATRQITNLDPKCFLEHSRMKALAKFALICTLTGPVHELELGSETGICILLIEVLIEYSS